MIELMDIFANKNLYKILFPVGQKTICIEDFYVKILSLIRSFEKVLFPINNYDSIKLKFKIKILYCL